MQILLLLVLLVSFSDCECVAWYESCYVLQHISNFSGKKELPDDGLKKKTETRRSP